MKPTKIYYKGELVKTYFNYFDEMTDIYLKDGRFVKDVHKSELMVSLVDAQAQIREFEKKLIEIKEIVKDISD
jgi:hypothetical protein